MPPTSHSSNQITAQQAPLQANRARKAAQAVPGGEAHRTKMSDLHAEHDPEALMDPADQWGTLGVHVVTAKGARGARVGGGVTNCVPTLM